MTTRTIALIGLIQEAIEALALDPDQISAALEWLKAPGSIDDLAGRMGLDAEEAAILAELHDDMDPSEGLAR